MTETETETEHIWLGAGFTDETIDSIRAYTFGHLIRLGGSVPERYRSDFYRDAQWLMEYMTEPMTFYWSVGDCGTHIARADDRYMREAIAETYGHYTHYRLAVHRSDRDVWTLDVTRVGSPTD